MQDDPFAALPMPALRPLTEAYGILVTGIGGTGVMTVGALIGMAAHLEGKGCTVLDFTGLAQKNGAVMSHVRLAPDARGPARRAHRRRRRRSGARLRHGRGRRAGRAVARRAGRTKAVINGDVQPIAAFVMNGDIDLGAEAMMKSIRDAAGEEAASFVDGTGLATAILGDSIATNLFMLGYALQKGLLPLSLEAHRARDRAQRRGGRDKQADLRLGPARRPRPRRRAGGRQADAARSRSRWRAHCRTIVAKRVELLTAYQDKAYAARYRAFVDKVARAEKDKAPGRRGLAEAVAKSLYKLMTYKDEYEVARLYTDGEFLKRLGTQFEGDYKLTFHLAPPLFADRDPATGQLKKREYGAWMMPMFRLLASLRRLRGTRLDIFGYTAERRRERRLIGEYEATVRDAARRSRPEQPRARRPDCGVAGDDARLRAHQGQEHRDGQGARGDPARRLPQPGTAVGRRRIAPEKGGTPALPNGVGGGSAGVP